MQPREQHQQAARQWIEHLSRVEDPRSDQGKRHELVPMLFMALMAVMSGADGWIAIENFCVHQQSFFEQFFSLRYGIPTHDTFERVLGVLKPKALSMCLTELLQRLHPGRKDKHIAIDGKTLCGSFQRAAERNTLHLLSAFATESGLVLGQCEVDKKTNEVKALPELLEMVEIKGKTVTLDALYCQKEVTKLLTKKQADYVITLKDNQPTMRKDVEQYFAFAQRMNFVCNRMGKPFGHSRFQSVDADHGRLEERTVDCLDAQGDWFHRDHHGWDSVKTVARVYSKCTASCGTVSEQTRYFISSRHASDARNMADAIRGHWMIENALHWTLDTAFGEDRSRISKDHGAQNLALLRRIANGLLRLDTKSKVGLGIRRQISGWNPVYRLKLLGFS